MAQINDEERYPVTRGILCLTGVTCYRPKISDRSPPSRLCQYLNTRVCHIAGDIVRSVIFNVVWGADVLKSMMNTSKDVYFNDP